MCNGPLEITAFHGCYLAWAGAFVSSEDGRVRGCLVKLVKPQYTPEVSTERRLLKSSSKLSIVRSKSTTWTRLTYTYGFSPATYAVANA